MTSTVYHSTVSVLPFNWTPQKWVKPRFNPCAPQTRLNTHHKVCSKLTTLGEMFMTLITLSHATRFKDLAFSRILSRESLSSKVYSWGDKCKEGSEGEVCERLGAEVHGLYDKYVSGCQFMGNMMYGLPPVVPTYPGASTPINAPAPSVQLQKTYSMYPYMGPSTAQPGTSSAPVPPSPTQESDDNN